MKMPSYFMVPPKLVPHWHIPAWLCGLRRHVRGVRIITMIEATDFAIMSDGHVSLGFIATESHYACKRCWRTVE
jgi:hypothetical protein